MEYNFKAKVWLYSGEGAWHFVTLPPNVSAEIKENFGGSKAWGSIKVTATINGINWKTSIFRDSKSNSYLLPVKVDVRKRAKISVGNLVKVNIKLLV